jgi:hypothetical protein
MTPYSGTRSNRQDCDGLRSCTTPVQPPDFPIVDVGIAPMAFGLKMKDGHGVVIRPPQACDGETTENGEVPQNPLPIRLSPEFARWWPQREVARPLTGQKRIDHPTAGRMLFEVLDKTPY